MSNTYLRYFAIIIISVIWLFIGCEKVEKPIENEPRIEIIKSTNEFLEFRVHIPEFKFYDVKTENYILSHTKSHYSNDFYLLRTVPGIGEILGLVMLYEIHDIKPF